MNPQLSIISVVLNEAAGLQRTIESVVKQVYKNFEYIIIDGGSDQATIEVIKKNESSIDYWVTERDLGIYDAMNKGVANSRGDWVLFLNAGDSLFGDDVLKEVFGLSDISHYDILFGDHVVNFNDFRGEKRRKAGKVKSIKLGSQFCHQSAFIRRTLLANHKYNIENRIGADFEFFYDMYLDQKKFRYLGSVISQIENGGLSDINQIEVIKSWKKVVSERSKDYTLRVRLYYHMLILVTHLRQATKRILYAIKSYV